VEHEPELADHVIKLSPALITIIDGRTPYTPAEDLQREVLEQARTLAAHGIESFHLDINYEDYEGFSGAGPDRNAAVFTPEFVAELCDEVPSLTLHLLTLYPDSRLRQFEDIRLSAVCFQLDVVGDQDYLSTLIGQIRGMGACASPVIETVGTERQKPMEPEAVRALLEPFLPQIGMLTFQAAGTASRTNAPAGAFARDLVKAYIDCLRPGFDGAIQMQGGITTATLGEAVKLGAEYLVCGTQLFRNREGLTAVQVAEIMRQEAATALASDPREARDPANQEVVEALWKAFDRFDFDAAGDLLHDDFVCEWPQSNERIRGKDNFIAVNKHYPGQWRIQIQNTITSGDTVVTEVVAQTGDQSARAISFFTLKDGKIFRLREFWPDPYPAPEWRAQWVEITG